ncbi:hypothetical protein [Longimicrobium sp.]|uniref:hypothetical protein n=1 Tax=Longimicrobium sp. TaxID=2029185 RepID=UPI002B9DD958|nr:hypothetical protein [Longimicrobium sp.]HSU12999.1 hypothetical protein [Longimicrobium sp.]
MQARDPEVVPDPPSEPVVRRVRRLAPGFIPPSAARQADAAEPEGRLLRPAAACPRCGARPAMRVTQVMVHALDGQPAGARVGTYQCQRRGCGAIYDLSVAAYQRAS